ncbi:hypothetical protein Y032_0384g390 [Ancylostoma ceylanicum]|uniref:Uncharacterized protein n=1 Tax=Ancylostoma ceylanicum TaxID=53326 RepID=A0A016RTE3_9BILA|nr:hypothetical protein Y032_0384g390 [Ancylostoma ceylanicum]
MSADKSWDRGAVFLRVSALHAMLNPCRRERETRAAAPTLVCGHLELSMHKDFSEGLPSFCRRTRVSKR